MKLELKKPIIFFDLETTGVSTSKDRIVEISILKIHPNQIEESKTVVVNPEMPIPKEVSKIHGITDEDVKDKPTFKQIAKDIYSFIRSCDIAGFNSNLFDVPLLVEEFLRTGMTKDEIDSIFKESNFVDVQVIFHKKEQRTLSAAYKFYCKEELKNAHSAEADVRATYEVLKAQIEKYSDLENDIEALSKISYHKKSADFAGRIGYDKDGNEILNFGKHAGKKLTDLAKYNNGYLDWIMKGDFPIYTKMIVNEIKQKPKAKKTTGIFD